VKVYLKKKGFKEVSKKVPLYLMISLILIQACLTSNQEWAEAPKTRLGQILKEKRAPQPLCSTIKARL